MKIKFIFIALILFLPLSIFGEVRLFLFPRVSQTNNVVKLGDITVLEGNIEVINIIKELIIDKSIYADGYIDRKEIYSLLDFYRNDISIIGSSVRVKNSIKHITGTYLPGEILKGESIRIIILKNNIRLEIKGRALSSGFEGEIIPVRVKSGKRLNGKILSSKMVEIIL
jgi:flagellar basal body P-ring formation chaperone FlgA